MPQALATTRRRNLLLQLSIFTHRAVDEGAKNGASTAFAVKIGIHKSLLSKLKTERDISDALARQIEAKLGLELGWMDTLHEDAPPTSAESSIQDLVLEAYRATNAQSRTALRKLLKLLSEGLDIHEAYSRLPSAKKPPTQSE